MEHMSVEEILHHLDEMYPDAHCELIHHNSYELSVAVILSAQTTDASVNRVTPKLFSDYPDVYAMAAGDPDEIAEDIRSLGLYRNKARSIHGFAKGVVERFHGEVPHTMEELTSLPGVGRKCANVILSEAFGIPALAVDTHVTRVSKRLGLVYQKDDVQTIERKLKKKVPKDRWTKTHHQMIFFGRYRCHARNPECTGCPFVSICHEKNKHFKKEGTI